MSDFSPFIIDYWATAFSGKPLHSNEYVTITVNPDLDDDQRVAVLWTAEDHRVAITVAPAVADVLSKDIAVLGNPTETDIRVAIANRGIALNDADNVFYLTKSAAEDVLGDAGSTNVRQLTDADTDMFAAFKAGVSEEDWDSAYVELDHWAVFGAFDDHERLACIGSMYPWDDEFPLADIGVLTLSSARGRGYAKTLVRAMFRYALAEGYEPQYRCQLDNAASNGLATRLDLQLFGRWEAAIPAAGTANA
ncbi:hypothetical protein A5784_07975 [Mycobacterium sp. 852013-50091_SCH5140682]|uniref:GNAT family N-acetyltransferase n=1 Tax=Mycobacterium sp. 852013-50091_SCH5140682 TaxID=1834109 RepID=UPI0007E990E3|nr:GNAT family N-acetyltransferase [Mycobacterium sp. 852013-50091_SCH5140682]OBC07724.1 hypothetical protein A5784_07975 [Mycobacterium sp. 852013-50091_SCH5140682]